MFKHTNLHRTSIRLSTLTAQLNEQGQRYKAKRLLNPLGNALSVIPDSPNKEGKTMDNYKVYRHTTPSNKVYIGITSQTVERRWRANGEGYKGSPVFYNAIKKYGWNNIEHEVLFDGLTYDEAEAMEIALISQYRSCERSYGYNMESGGVSGKKLSEETKKKISEAQKNRDFSAMRKGYEKWYAANGGNWNKGKKCKPHTEEWKRKMSERMRGENNPAYGKDYSHLRKNYDTNRSGKEHPRARSIIQYTIDGKFVAKFDTIQSVAENFGKAKASDVSNVTACANGRRKSAYGFVWKYATPKGDD